MSESFEFDHLIEDIRVDEADNESLRIELCDVPAPDHWAHGHILAAGGKTYRVKRRLDEDDGTTLWLEAI